MPDDVRDMLVNSPKKRKVSGATPKIKIAKSPSRSPNKSPNRLSADATPKRKTISRERKRQQLSPNAVCTLNDKFEEEKKRKIIGDFLNNPKPELSDFILQQKPKSIPKIVSTENKEETAMVVINAFEETVDKKRLDSDTQKIKTPTKTLDKEKQVPKKAELKLPIEKIEKTKIESKVEKPKVNMFNVVIASAAAEVVNLKSKGNIFIKNHSLLYFVQMRFLLPLLKKLHRNMHAKL